MELNLENRQNDNFRFERKFLTNALDREALQNIVAQIPMFFTEVYHERWINNIYFDSVQFTNFKDNVVGNMHRKKYRIRWYGEMISKIDNPILELKIKKGLLGDKKSFKINPFELKIGMDSNSVLEKIKESNIDSRIKYHLLEQKPVLLNRYRRKYFQSADKKFRITIDDEQSFYKIDTFNNSFEHNFKDPDSIILEIKYDKKNDVDASLISNTFPFRLTKSSKYARGIELLYF